MSVTIGGVNRQLTRTVLRYIAAAAVVFVIVFAYHRVIKVNPTTVALTFLLAVLAVSTTWGLRYAVFMAVVATLVLGFVMTIVILKVLDAVMGLRVTDDDEMAGLDLSQHSETAYSLGGSSYGEYGMSGSGGAFAEAMKAAQAKHTAH